MRAELKWGMICLMTAGCGGSGGSSDDDRPTYTEMEAAGNNLDAQFESIDFSDTIPTTGTATYDGYIKADTSEVSLFGELELEADFANATLTGTADNFADENDVKYTGALDVSGEIKAGADPNLGPANPNGAQVAATLTGTLTADGENFEVDGFLGGNFHGPDREAIIGLVLGDVTTSSGTETFTGEFIVVK